MILPTESPVDFPKQMLGTTHHIGVACTIQSRSFSLIQMDCSRSLTWLISRCHRRFPTAKCRRLTQKYLWSKSRMQTRLGEVVRGQHLGHVEHE